MTAVLPDLVLPPPAAVPSVHAPKASLASRVTSWSHLHRHSLVLALILLAVAGLVHGWNMGGSPGFINDDEGTYVAQAWAVERHGALAHYTYWYDHPPLGWLVIAAYSWVTDGFDRVSASVMVGREVMLLAHLASCALLFILARRLHFHRVTAAVVLVLFALSPVAIHYHRMAFLDNLAVTWLLAAMVLAVSPRRSLAAAMGSGACFAAAVLTKETTALLLPPLLWMLIAHSAPRTRKWCLGVFLAVATTLTAMYPLYALLKNELLPGPGHVSLWWAINWQLFDRAGSGSLLDSESHTYGLAHSWVDMDPWLLLVGCALVPVALTARRLAPIALALGLQVLLLLRGGYTPYPYVISLLPFAALVAGGVLDMLWRGRDPLAIRPPRRPWLAIAGRMTSRAVVVAGAVAFIALAVPAWGEDIGAHLTQDRSDPTREASAYVVQHLPRDAVILVDDYLWTDLAREGFANQIWFYKADLDPAVQSALLPNGYTDVDYVVLGPLGPTMMAELPTVAEAINNSEVVESFGDGEIAVRRVHKTAKD